MNLSEYLKKYLSLKSGTSKNNQQKIKRNIDIAIKVFGAEIPYLDNPKSADYQQLQDCIKQTLHGRKKGEKKTNEISPRQIKDTIAIIRNFYKWVVEQQVNLFSMEEKEMTQENNFFQAPITPPYSPVDYNNESTKRKGRPKTTGRREKFTLYMTAENLLKLQELSNVYNTTVTEILNNLIERYCEDNSAILETVKQQKEVLQQMIKQKESKND